MQFRAAHHRFRCGQGEEYKLFWPKKKADFVRVAAANDAIIVPFGAIGAADSIKILLDSKELKSLPVLGDRMSQTTSRIPAARRGMWAGEEEEDFSFPLGLPSPSGPARFYFLFGEPIDTRELDPKDRGELVMNQLPRAT